MSYTVERFYGHAQHLSDLFYELKITVSLEGIDQLQGCIKKAFSDLKFSFNLFEKCCELNSELFKIKNMLSTDESQKKAQDLINEDKIKKLFNSIFHDLESLESSSVSSQKQKNSSFILDGLKKGVHFYGLGITFYDLITILKINNVGRCLKEIDLSNLTFLKNSDIMLIISLCVNLENIKVVNCPQLTHPLFPHYFLERTLEVQRYNHTGFKSLLSSNEIIHGIDAVKRCFDFDLSIECLKIEMDRLIEILKQTGYDKILEELNLSHTKVTANDVYKLLAVCPNVKKLIIKYCFEIKEEIDVGDRELKISRESICSIQ